MFKRKILSLLTACAAAAAVCSCSKPWDKPQVVSDDKVKQYTGFFIGPRENISGNERIRKLIAEKTGAECEERWLSRTDNRDDIINIMINKADYPDFIYAGTDTSKFIEAGALIPLEGYIDKNPELKNYFTEEEWERIRFEDGHIYYIPCFSKVNGYDTNTIHNDEAFWIQASVLKWAGYPEIETLDEYFGLIESYLREHPESVTGTHLIGYEILTEGYFYFCLENPPQFLDGYPNDGCCIVDRETNTVIDYNTTPTAKKWFKKLNDEYRNGVIDLDCFVMSANQYYEKLASGCVLGMTDQFWNFGFYVKDLPEEYQYVPLGLTIEKGMTEHYHSEPAFDSSQGIGVSVSCKDPDGAVNFINDLLDPEIFTLRMWGEEGVDYTVGDDGVFSLVPVNGEENGETVTRDGSVFQSGLMPEQYDNGQISAVYPYFPIYKGMNPDGINAWSPEYQPSEFYEKLSDTMKECFDAYGVRTFVQLLDKSETNAPWYPMWSYTNTFTTDTVYGKAKKKMDDVKHEYLPKVVMSTDFEAAWEEYMDAYEDCNVKAYLHELQNEVTRRTKY